MSTLIFWPVEIRLPLFVFFLFLGGVSFIYLRESESRGRGGRRERISPADSLLGKDVGFDLMTLR